MTGRRRDPLGLDRSISRRDFLSGVAAAVAGACARPKWLAALESAGPAAPVAPVSAGSSKRGLRPARPAAYPPSLAGLRGAHPGSFEAAHALKDGAPLPAAEETGERYDLIVVGAGLSGLSAACFFRKAAGPKSRVLLLDPHDDFGGHAKRNEFRVGKRVLLAYGGSQSIDTPSSFSPEGKALLSDIGVRLERFHAAFDRDLYPSLGLTRGVFFDRETFGEDRLVAGEPPGPEGRGRTTWEGFLAATPLPEEARRDVRRVQEELVDYFPGLSPGEKAERLRRLSYRDYLLDVVRVGPLASAYFQARAHDELALGADAVSAWWCFSHGKPGFSGLGLGNPPALARAEPYVFHFPDGNAGVARLMVRSLLPGALPGATMEDSVTRRLDYGRLDEPASAVRLRLGSTALRAANAAGGVEVVYSRGGRAFKTTGGACVLACDNAMIPYLCPELPDEQRAALGRAVRAPLVYTNVLLRDRTAFERLGVSEIHCPGAYYSDIALDFPVSLGRYRFGRSASDPVVVRLLRAPLKPGLPAREQFRAGRAELLTASFSEIERATRDQLARALGGGGFDPARDLLAITVNRWPHGYAEGANSLFEPDWKPGEAPWELGRRRLGRIAIANSDAGGSPFMQAAFAQAHRAVSELL